MVVVQESGADRTYLHAVTRLLSMVGDSEVSTLKDPTGRTVTAMRCVHDARDEVYYRTLWEWRRQWERIELVASTMWYALPTDYCKMASGLSRNSTERGPAYITYDQLLSNYPYLRDYPPGSGVEDIHTLVQLLAQTNTFGESKYYVITQSGNTNYIGLWPIPDSDFVTAETYLYFSYWDQAGALLVDSDSIGLPQQLWNAAHYLALGQLKKALEYSDWREDYAIGTKALTFAAGGKRESEDTTIYDNPTINYNE